MTVGVSVQQRFFSDIGEPQATTDVAGRVDPRPQARRWVDYFARGCRSEAPLRARRGRNRACSVELTILAGGEKGEGEDDHQNFFSALLLVRCRPQQRTLYDPPRNAFVSFGESNTLTNLLRTCFG